MSDNSAIEWTDATWNPVRGCTKVSPGCANCYAETFAERFRGVKGHPYEQGFDLRLVPEKLEEPLRWKKPKRIFVNSMSDLFQEGVPDEFIDQAFAVMAMAPQHTFQVLTKRADRMRAYLTAAERQDAIHDAAFDMAHDSIANTAFMVGTADRILHAWPLSNVWLGVSVENQHFADERIPLLLQTPAAMRFISAEPLLERINLNPILPPWRNPTLDWVIVGGESGHGARPFDVAWARSIIAQCTAAGVACFVKQLGANPTGRCTTECSFDHDMTFKSRKGGDPSEWPEDLRVREFPEARA